MYGVELSCGGKCDGHRVALCGGGAASGVFCVAGCWLMDYQLT